MVNPWFSPVRILSLARPALLSQSMLQKPRNGNGQGAAAGKNPWKGSVAVEQLAFGEKNLRDRPPFFRRADLPIPAAPWFRRTLRGPSGRVVEAGFAEEDELS
ncbi:hypothetical protein RJ55_08685 [Drechmeria coniospora]|nr:hypothetical protein RJ55_08685 [Drechmeria coniospora]